MPKGGLIQYPVIHRFTRAHEPVIYPNGTFSLCTLRKLSLFEALYPPFQQQGGFKIHPFNITLPHLNKAQF